MIGKIIIDDTPFTCDDCGRVVVSVFLLKEIDVYSPKRNEWRKKYVCDCCFKRYQ